MKKKFKILIYSIILLFAVSGFLDLPIFTSEADASTIAQGIKMPIPSDSALIYYKDTHGGFHGDGMTYGVLKLSEKGNIEFRKNFLKKSVHKLPVTDNIKNLIKEYFNDDEDIEIGYEDEYISGRVVTFPNEIKKGYYYFIDRNVGDYPDHKYKSIKDVDLDSISLDISMLIYDEESQELFFYEIDT